MKTLENDTYKCLFTNVENDTTRVKWIDSDKVENAIDNAISIKQDNEEVRMMLDGHICADIEVDNTYTIY